MAPDDRFTVPPPASWWPAVMMVVMGVPLLADRVGMAMLDDWARSLLTVLFAAAVAAFIVGDFFRFVLWWFFRRHT